MHGAAVGVLWPCCDAGGPPPGAEHPCGPVFPREAPQPPVAGRRRTWELSGTLIFDQPDGLDTVSVDDAARVNGWAGTGGVAMRPIIQL
jgi:hypothetical protein